MSCWCRRGALVLLRVGKNDPLRDTNTDDTD
jgi:hypothetical protein